MASSDDEEEILADAVSDYYFCDGDDEPLSFAKLPLQWNKRESENSSDATGQIFLRGNADHGLQTLYKAVKAWNYDFSNANPEVSVLSKENHWIKLQKPRKSYEDEIRTILITLHCLYFFKGKPEASARSLWDHLSKVFSLYDIRPSESDLIDHMNFIRDAVNRDEALGKSKFLAAFLENPRKKKLPEEITKPSFIVDDTIVEPQDDDFITKQNEDSESDEEDDHFDSVCAICDNGGNLTCCEGKCFRSFHANVDSEEAEESNCESLGLTAEEVKRIHQYRCENCLYSRHQCFVCGVLGSSDKSSGAEVFRCSGATCGHFYHPKCVAKRLHPNAIAERKDVCEKIGAGEPFICPAHKCDVCKQTENEKVEDLQFAVCRRCPISYHRKCLPRDIKFEDQVSDDDDDVVRAWNDLLPKSRALIYCLNHDIDEDLCTPVRTLIFRDLNRSKTEQPSSKKKKVVVTDSEKTSKKSVMKTQKTVEKSSVITKTEDSSKKRAVVSSGSLPSKKKKVTDTSKNPLKRTLSTKVKKPASNDGQPSLGSRLFDYMNKVTEANNIEKDETCVDDTKQTMAVKSLQEEISSPIDEDSKQRILKLMEDAASSITLEEVKKYHKDKVPSTHQNSSRVDKSIILARVEGSVEALHVALKKLEEGCSIEDAMAVCEPGVLDQLMRWKEKLRIYLAPFLHGMRYTSFGRHFTKVEKLEKIVDKLKYYIKDGDMVVDFCCGANDFSCLLKNRLDEMGKTKCSYKNYDITRPKNDFNFEKRDWMSVRTRELPDGSELIMGLNPPFGKNAGLANQFIERALRFMPKLIVLIVPPETERLDSDKMQCPYELVWEDIELLSGKSFYLPGSVDINEKQMDQWNNITPPLYLWSRPDWTSIHKAIAQKQGHIHIPDTQPQANENAPPVSDEKKEVVEKEPDLPVPVVVINKDLNNEAKPNIKSNNKEASPAHDDDNGGAETKVKKQEIMKEEKSSNNSRKRNRNNQEETDASRRRDLQPQKKPKDKHSHRDQTEDKRSPPVPLSQKLDEKKPSPPPARQDPPPETTPHSSGQPFDRHLDQRNRYNPPTCEVLDQHVERRYNTVPATTTAATEPPYMYRRHDLATPPSTYLMRPEPSVQYSTGYDHRVGRGCYNFDEMNARGGGYAVSHHDPGLNRYGPPDHVVQYNRTSTSTMQRYAPRLDELNHTRMNRPELDEMNHSRMGNYGRAEPPRGGYGPPPPPPPPPPPHMHGPGFGADSMGFAPGPYNSYSHHNSSGGWLNE